MTRATPALSLRLLLSASILMSTASLSATAAIITSSDIIPMPSNAVGSGNGTLDFILLTESAGGTTNSSGPFNADDANSQMPTGNGNTTANEAFITSMGELRSFYRLNFPDGHGGSTVNQIVVFVDVNETGGPQTINLDTFDVILDYNQTFSDGRDNPHLVDLSSAQQNSTNTGFSGGTLAATLDATPKVLGQTNIGAGHADQVIITGINPFDPAFTDSTRFLLHWRSSDMDNGGETIFLSGQFAPQDVGVPEPCTLTLLAGATLVLRRRRPALNAARA